ncbi:L,D-transpeptidase family protein [Beijerinckia indica]|uniref:Peptidoglycan-binding domain 1 protein n=1 Tax=Beijerinckia indica subsp. indica (strain ATCC 9039 / DSM 1715 / NCIMB 8712) TaxID=395963 RepID=B2IBS7_BEII9|nr:L,D-transpeptidase family protein [Beijerinckia indica]ACB93799.1 Peptidoglycan-binding domain 1 protein [Beijerinckia indica subsp. indica ATCC 9039]
MRSPGKSRGPAASRPSRLALLMIAGLGMPGGLSDAFAETLAPSKTPAAKIPLAKIPLTERPFIKTQFAKTDADEADTLRSVRAPSPLPASSTPPTVQSEDSVKPDSATDKKPETAMAPAIPASALQKLIEDRAERPVTGPHITEQRREREAIAAFYAARDFALLWFTDGHPNRAARSLLPRLAAAAEDGLDLGPRLPALPPDNASADSNLDETRQAALDLALSEAVVAYGRQASGSRIDPHEIGKLIGARPEIADPSLILASVAAAGPEAGTILRGFNPQQEGYVALRDKLVAMRQERQPVARRLIPSGPPLRVGMRDPRVALIRARLSLDGKLDKGQTENGASEIYDSEVSMAVADFQRANGLPASGVLTPQTSAILSGARLSATPLSPHVEHEILANMERWRWMPHDLGHDRIEVNLPDFEVAVIEKDEVVSRHRVVIGKEETPTPIFSHVMQFLIVNPYWNVPASILKKEMLPKLAANPNYLHRLGYEVFKRDGHLVVRQPPGERNALGRIKFMFPNDYAVYLHDTPSKHYFEEDKRAFSHGCVRVDEPYHFAEAVLGPKWSESRIKGLFGEKERYITLPKPLPIHLEYFTATVDRFGHLHLSEDVYGYSQKVRIALGLQD